MTHTSLLVKMLVTSIFVSSATLPYDLVINPEAVKENSAKVISSTTPLAVVSTKITKTKKDKGDCTKYSFIFEKYDWPVDIAMQVCKYESQGNEKSIGDRDTNYASCGLMQIRTLPGRPSCEELKDPETNIEFAYNLWSDNGWRPWSVCQKLVDCE